MVNFRRYRDGGRRGEFIGGWDSSQNRKGSKPMKKLWMAPVILVLGIGCAGTSEKADTDSGKTMLQSMATIAGIAASIYFPEAAPAIQAVCTASGSRDQSLMVTALQALWTDANKQQASEVVGAVNAIVGESKIMDGNMTEAQLSHMQEVLGGICCSAGACAK